MVIHHCPIQRNVQSFTLYELVCNAIHHLLEYMGSAFKGSCLSCQPMTDLCYKPIYRKSVLHTS